MKRWAFAILLLVASPAMARELYFSDCDYDPRNSGCNGLDPTNAGGFTCADIADGTACEGRGGDVPGEFTSSACECPYVPDTLGQCPTWYLQEEVDHKGEITNPYCLDPLSTGTRNSFQGITLQAGDIVYLCSGACDGIPNTSRTFYLKPGSTWITPAVNNVTVMSYAGENVILSGDSDGDGTADAAEGERIVDQTVNHSTGWTFRDVTFDRWVTDNGEEVFYLNEDPSGWIFDNITMTHIGGYAWTDTALADSGCSDDSAPHIFKVASLTGTFIVRNSLFQHICAFVHRATVNNSATSILYQNNRYIDVIVVTNDFQNRNVTIKDNYLEDVYDGIAVEERMTNVVVEGNILYCAGLHRVGSGGRCSVGIGVTDGDNAGQGGVITTGVYVRRNRIFGRVSGDYNGSSGAGWWLNPVKLTAGSDRPINLYLENNFIWHHWGWANDCLCMSGSDCSSCSWRVPDTEWAGPAIYVSSNRDEVYIQNNTVYDSKIGVVLDGQGAGRAYTLRYNLFVRERKSTSAKPAIVVLGRAIGSFVTGNMIMRNTAGSTTEQIAWVSSGPTVDARNETAAGRTCSDMPALGLANGSGNSCVTARLTFCDSANFCNCGVAGRPACSTDWTAWDLHLSGVQSAVAGCASGTCSTCATEDIDQQSRTGAGLRDCGADELYGAGQAFTGGNGDFIILNEPLPAD